MPENLTAIHSRKVRDFVRTLIDDLRSPHHSDDRIVVTVLMMAMFDAILDEWEAVYTAAGLENEVAVARKLMANAGYNDDFEPICGMPGMKPVVVMVDGQEAIAYSHSMSGLMPLSAIFTNKVRESIEIAAMVGDLIQAQKDGGASGSGGGSGKDHAAPQGKAQSDPTD